MLTTSKIPQITLLAAVASVLLIATAYGTAQSVAGRTFWFKGNTHTHTSNSDGDSPPEAVAQWYRDHGYNFLVITDHEFITPVEPLNAAFAKAGEFLVIPGQEVTDSFNKKPCHVNGLGITRVVMPRKTLGVVENLQADIDNIRNAGGIAQVNHPNFGWALTAENLKALQDYSVMEIYSGHPLVNYLGGGGVPGAEELWDAVLSSGKIVFGVATDDVHHFMPTKDLSPAPPGMGWIVVRAPELSTGAVMDAVRRGDFYASNGVELENYASDAKGISIKIREKRWSKYRIQFIGKGGRILSEAINNPASYVFRGDEGYVRAKILESNGKMAWTQPVFFGRK
jgi:hypothetical protein